MKKLINWFDGVVERFASENLKSRIKTVKWLSLGSLMTLLTGAAFFYQKSIEIDFRTIAMVSVSNKGEAFAFVSLPREFETALRGEENVSFRLENQWLHSKILGDEFEEGVMLILDNETKPWTDGQRVELILRFPGIRLGDMFFRKQVDAEEAL
jgi:hypothetical protein